MTATRSRATTIATPKGLLRDIPYAVCADSIALPSKPPREEIGQLGISFSSSEGDVPPAFYPGDSIPTTISLLLPPGSILPLVNPSFTLSLVGKLCYGGEVSTPISASISLSAGLALWVLDAGGVTHLPDGMYTLPLSVYIPYFPPSHSGAFTLSYYLSATLCSGDSVITTAAPLELLPTILPTPPPVILPHSFWIPRHTHTQRVVLSAHIPTGSYAPTSIIPLCLKVGSPKCDSECEESESEISMVIRTSLIREETVNSTTSTTTLYSRLDTATSDLSLSLPLMSGNTWRHGYTTTFISEHVFVRASFILRVEMCFVPPNDLNINTINDGKSRDLLWEKYVQVALTPPRSLCVPINVGSVAEPGYDEGWICPPPCYELAIRSAPYVLD